MLQDAWNFRSKILHFAQIFVESCYGKPDGGFDICVMVDWCSAAAVASHLDVAWDKGMLYSFENVEDGNFSIKCRSEPDSPSIIA